MKIHNNEHYDPSILSNLIQDIQESDDKSQDTLKRILHNYGVMISETFTVQDFIKKCSEIPGVDEKVLAIFDLFGVENQDNIESSEGASEKMRSMMQSQYDKMNNSNKPYGDLKKLQSWTGLDYREESGVKVVNVPGFGEICITTIKLDIYCDDLYKNEVVSVDDLKDSKKFELFASTINGCEMMLLSDFYNLMNIIAQRLDNIVVINEDYMIKQQIKFRDENLSLEHDLGRILRALEIITGESFSIPIHKKGKTVMSLMCGQNGRAYFHVYTNFTNSVYATPLAKIIKY